MMLLTLVVGLLVASVVSAQTNDALDDILCAKDISTRASVLQCLASIPMSHFEIVKMCFPRVATLGSDPTKFLNYYCQNNGIATSPQSAKCMADMYENQGKSIEESLRPAVECLQGLMRGK